MNVLIGFCQGDLARRAGEQNQFVQLGAGSSKNGCLWRPGWVRLMAERASRFCISQGWHACNMLLRILPKISRHQTFRMKNDNKDKYGELMPLKLSSEFSKQFVPSIHPVVSF